MCAGGPILYSETVFVSHLSEMEFVPKNSIEAPQIHTFIHHFWDTLVLNACNVSANEVVYSDTMLCSATVSVHCYQIMINEAIICSEALSISCQINPNKLQIVHLHLNHHQEGEKHKVKAAMLFTQLESLQLCIQAHLYWP